jgi:hypothetical protein
VYASPFGVHHPSTRTGWPPDAGSRVRDRSQGALGGVASERRTDYGGEIRVEIGGELDQAGFVKADLSGLDNNDLSAWVAKVPEDPDIVASAAMIGTEMEVFSSTYRASIRRRPAAPLRRPRLVAGGFARKRAAYRRRLVVSRVFGHHDGPTCTQLTETQRGRCVERGRCGEPKMDDHRHGARRHNRRSAVRPASVTVIVRTVGTGGPT